MITGHDDECEAEFIGGAMNWTLCGCGDRLTGGDEDEPGNPWPADVVQED